MSKIKAYFHEEISEGLQPKQTKQSDTYSLYCSRCGEMLQPAGYEEAECTGCGRLYTIVAQPGQDE
jgi:rRNA maturation endonuclease Nob1